MSLGHPAPRYAAPRPAETTATAAPLDLHRALQARAFCALIDAEIAANRTTRAAEVLLNQIVTSGLCTLVGDGDRLTLTLFGITATTTTPSAPAVLRLWQAAVADRLAQGVRP